MMECASLTEGKPYFPLWVRCPECKKQLGVHVRRNGFFECPPKVVQ